jgi:hypothetical protein
LENDPLAATMPGARSARPPSVTTMNSRPSCRIVCTRVLVWISTSSRAA